MDAKAMDNKSIGYSYAVRHREQCRSVMRNGTKRPSQNSG